MSENTRLLRRLDTMGEMSVMPLVALLLSIPIRTRGLPSFYPGCGWPKLNIPLGKSFEILILLNKWPLNIKKFRKDMRALQRSLFMALFKHTKKFMVLKKMELYLFPRQALVMMNLTNPSI